MVGSAGRKSREHRRYLSIGESEGSGVFDEEEEESEPSGRPGSRVLFSRGQDAGGAGNELRGGDGKENVTERTRDTRVFGGMTKLGPPGSGAGRFGKSPDGIMYDGDGFLKELDAWLR